MPTYEYECERCGKTFESFQSISDEKLEENPNCGKKKRGDPPKKPCKLRRLLFARPASLKGSGWTPKHYE
jgi:putative FmdB family regulatory protein